MNRDFKVGKLIIKDIIGEAISLYKDNFGLFFGINAIGVLIFFVPDSFLMLREFANTSGLAILIDLVSLVIIYIGIYYSIRMTILLALVIKHRYSNEPVNIKEIYVQAKSCTWNQIKAVLLLGLMLIIPITFIILGFSIVESIPLKIITISIGVILFSYLIAKYELALYVVIFKPKAKNYFSYSQKLVENYFWKVLIISWIPFIVTVPNYILKFFVDGSNLGIIQGFIYANSGLLIRLFIGPFTTGIMVTTYLKLDREEVHTTNEGSE